MRALKLTAQVAPGHTVHLELPDDVEAGPVEVIVLVADESGGGAQPSEGDSLADILAGPRIDRRHLRSKEEIDDYLRGERQSWG